MSRTAKSQWDSQPRAAVRRRWKRRLVVLGAAAVMLFTIPKLLDKQPRFQGRTVESWLLQTVYDPNSPQASEQARSVLRHMGRKAVPHIIKALGRRNTAMLNRYVALREKLPLALRNLLPERDKPDRLRRAARSELVVNPHTLEFLPEIIELLDDPDTNVRQETAWFFSDMWVYQSPQRLDIATLPTLSRALRDDHSEVRRFAALAISRFGSNAVDVVPNLVRLLNDTNEAVSYGAAFALVAIHEWEPAYRSELPTDVVARMEKIFLGATNQVLSNVTRR